MQPESAEAREKPVRDKIRDAVREYGHPGYSAPKARVDGFTCHKQLKPSDVESGVIAFALFQNMVGGSDADVDLYTLLKAYLLDLDKRAQLNEVLGTGRKVYR